MDKKYSSSVLNYKIFNVIVLPIILFIITYFICGFYFETNDDYVMSLVYKGEWHPEGGAYEISMVYKWLSYVYAFLYKQIPEIPWYGFFLCLFNLIATGSIFYILENVLSKFLSHFKVSVFLVILYIILILENVTIINFTRTAILLAGSSLLLILYTVLGDKKYEQKIAYVAVCLVFFIIGFMVRPRAGILVPIMTLPFALYMGLKLIKFKTALYLTITFLLFASALHYSSLLVKTQEELDNDKFSAYWVNSAEYELGKPIYVTNEQDSIKREALKYYFVIDKKEFSEGFFKRISSSELFLSNKLTLHRFKVALIFISINVFESCLGITVLNFFIFAVAVFGFLKKKKSHWIFYIFPHIVFWLLLFLIMVFMKLPHRLFTPLYIIYTLCNFWQMQGLEFNLNTKKILVFFQVSVIISFGISIYPANKKIEKTQTQYRENIEIFDYLRNSYNNSTFLITQPSATLLDCLHPLDDVVLKTNKLFPIIGWTTIFSSYRNEINSITGSLDINDFFDYLCSHKNFVLISNDKFNRFLYSYFKIIHNKEYKFVQKPNIPGVMKGRDLSLYTMEKQTE